MFCLFVFATVPQELPLLEAELGKRPNLCSCSGLDYSSSSKKGGHVDFKHQVKQPAYAAVANFNHCSLLY